MLVKNKNGHFWKSNKITESQYNEILSMLRTIPTAPDGYGYRLTEGLEWELYELPAEEAEINEGDDI
jgi:hypothetical protein